MSLALSLSKSSSSQWENQDYGTQVDKQRRYEYQEVGIWDEIWGEKGYKGNVVWKFVWYLLSLNIWVDIVTCHGEYFGFHILSSCFSF